MSKVKELTEQNILEAIEEWQFFWMNQRQNSQADYLNYRSRAFGIDANMRYSLARNLLKIFKTGQTTGIKDDERCEGCGSGDFVVARDMIGTRHCVKCKASWVPNERN